MRLMLATCMFVLASFTPASAADETVELDGMKSKVPAEWKQEQPSNSMRVYQMKLPKAEGDDSAPELVVFFFKAGSGSIEANLKRQEAKFEAAEGKKLDVKVEKTKVGKIDATYQDIKGTFLSKFPPFDPNAKTTRKADHRQIYVIFEGKTGQYYVTLLGSNKSVEKNKAAFDGFLKGFE